MHADSSPAHRHPSHNLPARESQILAIGDILHDVLQHLPSAIHDLNAVPLAAGTPYLSHQGAVDLLELFDGAGTRFLDEVVKELGCNSEGGGESWVRCGRLGDLFGKWERRRGGGRRVVQQGVDAARFCGESVGEGWNGGVLRLGGGLRITEAGCVKGFLG